MRRLVLLIGFLAAATIAYSQEGGPRITAIEPSFGPTAGGTEVTIHGSGFWACEFSLCPPLIVGGVAVPGAVTDTTARFTTPPHPPGEVEVLVPTPTGVILRTTFLYTDAETIPTLSEWALLLLAAALAVVGATRIR